MLLHDKTTFIWKVMVDEVGCDRMRVSVVGQESLSLVDVMKMLVEPTNVC